MEINVTKSISHYQRFFNKGIRLDCGPLLLLFYGEYDLKNDTDYLKKLGYNRIHFDALTKFLGGCPMRKGHKLRLIITPHIFTEFYKHAEKNFGKFLNSFFQKIKENLLLIEELNVNKNTLINQEKFVKLEIGEVSILCISEAKIHNDYFTIIHHDREIDREFRNDKNLLTIHDLDHIYSWYLTLL